MTSYSREEDPESRQVPAVLIRERKRRSWLARTCRYLCCGRCFKSNHALYTYATFECA